jgi:uncharacterized membrane-anchored protein YhcB (DUF1043 family)
LIADDVAARGAERGYPSYLVEVLVKALAKANKTAATCNEGLEKTKAELEEAKAELEEAKAELGKAQARAAQLVSPSYHSTHLLALEVARSRAVNRGGQYSSMY